MGTDVRGLRTKWLIISTLLLCGAVVLPSVALADRVETVSNPEYEAALGELDRITEEYNALAEQQDATLAKLEEARGKVSDNQAEIEVVQQEIEDRRIELSEKQATLAGHVSADYKSGGVNLLSIVLSSTSFEEAVSRFYYFNAISEAQVAEIDEINTLRSELQNRQEELEKLEEELEKQEESLEILYNEQREQADAMQEQQVAASEYLLSLPPEIQITIVEEEDDDELIGVAQLVVDTANEGGKADGGGDQGAADSGNGSSGKGDSGSNGNASNSSSGGGANTTPPAVTGSGTLQAVLNSAYSTSGAEALSNHWGCSGWVYTVFRNAGVSNFSGSANRFYHTWCYSSNRADLQPGMIVAVGRWPGTSSGRIYGHIGIYIGNGTVRHLSAGAVREVSLDQWCRTYGNTTYNDGTPRWGWNGGVALS
ncbi:MAG: hypothetical protein IJG82_01985 [Atopobiaceae bacterium]|nr:hypothetical protein [Atopobiaceae bacterium]MBQ6524424.1 hypothetical protein [Atopobiaceae bacterium]